MKYSWFSSVSDFPEKQFNDKFKKYLEINGGTIDPSSINKHNGKVSFGVFYNGMLNTESLINSWINASNAVA